MVMRVRTRYSTVRVQECMQCSIGRRRSHPRPDPMQTRRSAEQARPGQARPVEMLICNAQSAFFPCRLPAASYQLPTIANCQLPDSRQSAANWLPVGCQLPVASCQMPVASSRKEEGAAGRRRCSDHLLLRSVAFLPAHEVSKVESGTPDKTTTTTTTTVLLASTIPSTSTSTSPSPSPDPSPDLSGANNGSTRQTSRSSALSQLRPPDPPAWRAQPNNRDGDILHRHFDSDSSAKQERPCHRRQ